MKAVATIFITLTFSLIFASNTYSQKKQVKAAFCELSLSGSIKQANASFGNHYTFRIDKDNKPIEIDRLTGYDFINDEEVKSCISKWTFKNFKEDTRFIVSFYWKHMYGWQPIAIVSRGFSKTVKPSKK